MPFGRLRPEALLETLEKACCQGNFRQQDQHLPSLPQGLGYRLEIDLGLAGSGNPVDQRYRERRLPDLVDHLDCRLLLRPLQPGRHEIRIGLGNDRRRSEKDGLENPCFTRPSITLVDTPAAWARSLRVHEGAPTAISSTRLLAGVSRSGAPPTNLSPRPSAPDRRQPARARPSAPHGRAATACRWRPSL